MYAVNVNGRIEIVKPDTTVVTKHGNRQFWFFINGRKRLAVRKPNQGVFQVN